MKVVWSAAALRDLIAIRSYIAQDNPCAADRIATQLLAAADRLEHFPYRGRPGADPGTRELAVMRPYVIVYRIVGGEVQISRVWHGAQDRG